MNNDFDLMSGFGSSDLMAKVPVDHSKKFEADKRFWKLSKDETGRGSAIIRLVTDKNKLPYVRIFHYNSKKSIQQGDKKKDLWLIADSPATINLPDPIQEHYFNLKNDGNEKAAEFFKRKVKYITNIIVVKDPANPENDGKVFLFEFGQKLLTKFTNWMQPSETELALGESPKELFNPLKGNDIKLSICKLDSGFYDYGETSIMPTPTRLNNLPDTEEGLEKIKDILVNKTYDLTEFQKPEHFLSYDELKKKLDWFVNPFKVPQVETPVSVTTAPAPSATPAATAPATTPAATAPATTPADTAPFDTKPAQADKDNSWLDTL